MAYQVMHAKQVESKKQVLASAAQVDDMYDMLAAYEKKVRGGGGRVRSVSSPSPKPLVLPVPP